MHFYIIYFSFFSLYLDDVLGNSSFGSCRKMFLSATEVAVKEYKVPLSTRSKVMNEAKVMASVCCGHPNLPLFMGVYDFTGGLPYLVTKYYSVGGEPLTLHKLLRKPTTPTLLSSRQCIQLAVGICSAIESIHDKHILHNDIKCDNIVLSDLIPMYINSPPLWPVLIDFGKARPFTAPNRYFLCTDDKVKYRKDYPHLVPELIQGTFPQNVKTDIFSMGRVHSIISHTQNAECLASISNKCMSENHSSVQLHVVYIHCYVMLNNFLYYVIIMWVMPITTDCLRYHVCVTRYVQYAHAHSNRQYNANKLLRNNCVISRAFCVLQSDRKWQVLVFQVLASFVHTVERWLAERHCTNIKKTTMIMIQERGQKNQGVTLLIQLTAVCRKSKLGHAHDQ